MRKGVDEPFDHEYELHTPVDLGRGDQAPVQSMEQPVRAELLRQFPKQLRLARVHGRQRSVDATAQRQSERIHDEPNDKGRPATLRPRVLAHVLDETPPLGVASAVSSF